MSVRILAAAVLLVVMTGCASLPPERYAGCSAVRGPEVEVGADGLARTRIAVLSYNVEGLSWPVRSGRGSQLRRIARHLREMRARGEAPDIVLLQEVFSRAAARAARASGYPNLVAGPGRREARPARELDRLPGRRRPRQGEIGLRLASGGLVILSDFPIVERRSRPFPRGSCAGRDCLANKGMLYAKIAIPGVPGTIDLLNTHMNSAGASRVPQARHTASHRAQAAALSSFLAEASDIAWPVIFGGDFNMRHSEARFREFERHQPLEIVHRWCVARPDACDVRLSWDGEAPWLDTQDLQLFAPGRRMGIRPVRVEALFDGGAGGPVLSDHDGFLVTYELSWDADAAPAPRCPA